MWIIPFKLYKMQFQMWIAHFKLYDVHFECKIQKN